VAAGTIYQFFHSKEQLIDTLYQELKKSMGAALLRGYSNHLSHEDRFRLIWKNLFFHFIEHPDEFRFLTRYVDSPIINEKIRRGTKEYKPIRKLLREARRSGAIRNLNSEITLALLYGSVVSLADLHLRGTPIRGKVLEETIQSCWDAVRSSAQHK
jgi:AcrR family transcriptional regulator